MPDPSTRDPDDRFRVRISLDVQNLDESCAYWARLLGFRVVEIDRAGTLTESRDLECPEFPGVRMQFKSCWPRPVVGTALGSLRGLGFAVRDLPALVREFGEGLVWIQPPPADGSAYTRVIARDPNGYALELRGGHPADSASSGANPSC